MRDSTLLLRQVHPSFVQAGRVTEQAFRPTPKDNGLLSVYDGDMIGAEKAHSHYTDTLGLSSIGVLAVSVSECASHSLNTHSAPDMFPEHAVIDFSPYSKSEKKRKATHLRNHAANRGWLFQAQRA